MLVTEQADALASLDRFVLHAHELGLAQRPTCRGVESACPSRSGSSCARSSTPSGSSGAPVDGYPNVRLVSGSQVTRRSPSSCSPSPCRVPSAGRESAPVVRLREYYQDPNTPRAHDVLPAAFAAVRNSAGELLLVRRIDDGNWELPGGRIEVGETAATTVVREVAEESGITIELTGLAGVYSDPTHVLVDPDDTIHQQLALCLWRVRLERRREGAAALASPTSIRPAGLRSDQVVVISSACRSSLVKAAPSRRPPVFDAGRQRHRGGRRAGRSPCAARPAEDRAGTTPAPLTTREQPTCPGRARHQGGRLRVAALASWCGSGRYVSDCDGATLSTRDRWRFVI